MSSTDKLLKAAEKNLADAKKQYERVRQSEAGTESPLYSAMKANYENARRNLANVKELARLSDRPVRRAAVKPAPATSATPEKLEKKVDPNVVKLPDSAATIYFPKMDRDLESFVARKGNTTTRQASQWQENVIKKSTQPASKAAKTDSSAPDDDQVTLTREEYRKQLKKKK